MLTKEQVKIIEEKINAFKCSNENCEANQILPITKQLFESNRRQAIEIATLRKEKAKFEEM